MINVTLLSSRIAASFGVLVLAAAAHATTITSLAYGNSVLGVSTLNASISPIGVTLPGKTTNPFLNDLNTKAINLLPGSYLTYSYTFFTPGQSIEMAATFSNGAAMDFFALIPDMTKAGNIIFNKTVGNENLTLETTGLVADRVALGYGPGAFAPDGANDTVLEFIYSEGKLAVVPEPSTIALTGAVGVVLLVIAFLRRRRAAKQ